MQDRPVWRRRGFHQGNLAVPFRFTGTLDKAEPSECRGGKAAPVKGPRHEKQGTVNRSASSMTPAETLR